MTKTKLRHVHVADEEVTFTASIPRSLYEQVVEKLARNGSDLDTFIRLAMRGLARFPKEFDLSDKLSFGKYRDETVENVIRIDADYIEYCIREVQGFRLSEEAIELLQEVA